jgi:hypothetical protein
MVGVGKVKQFSLYWFAAARNTAGAGQRVAVLSFAQVDDVTMCVFMH